jgi:subtilisin family serine protease
MSTRRALRELRRADPEGVYDFNHLYLESGSVEASPPRAPIALASTPAPSAVGARVGLIDGGIDRMHEVFRDAVIHEHGCANSTPSAHGTAVASLLAGRSAEFKGAAPGAELSVADVYCGEVTGGAVDAVAEAFAWLLRERVPVINVSLVGPANALLEQVVRIVVARGSIVVAAVGNDGPASPPLFPAAYPGVIAVTGVDARRRVLLEACRGKHVRFAAPGADMSAAATEHLFAQVRGTSFAAPIVSGLLATHLRQPDRSAADAAIAFLTGQAIDLGARGIDKVYGIGLVGEGVREGREDVRTLGREGR